MIVTSPSTMSPVKVNFGPKIALLSGASLGSKKTVKAKESPSKGTGHTSYRGLVKIYPGCKKSKSAVRCDALILDTSRVAVTGAIRSQARRSRRTPGAASPRSRER